MQTAYEKLVSIGLPVHPLCSGDKKPTLSGWNTNPELHIPAPTPEINIGLRLGATWGMLPNRGYLSAIDCDLDEKIEKNTDGTIVDPGMAEKVRDEFSIITKYFQNHQIPSLTARSGGQHRGWHKPICSDIPFFHRKSIFSHTDVSHISVELYGMSKEANFQNLVISPSVVKYPYELVCDKNFSRDIDKICVAWQDLVNNRRISVCKWHEMMYLFYGSALEERDRDIFVLMHIPLIVSSDFNYEYFGNILSGIAWKAGKTKQLIEWTSDLLKLLPDSIRDNNTIEKILKFQRETPDRAPAETPGFPKLKEVLARQLCIQRSCESNNDLIRDVNSYADIIEKLFMSSVGRPARIDRKYKSSKESLKNFDPSQDFENQALLECFSNSENLVVGEEKNLVLEPGFLVSGIVLCPGDEGSSKTWQWMEAAHGLSTGESFWGGRYTPKAPCKVGYIYGDKSSHTHKNLYVNRLAMPRDTKNLKYIYPRDALREHRKAGGEALSEFDLSEIDSLTVLANLCRKHQFKIIILDTLMSLAPGLEIKKDESAKPFMSALRNLADTMDITIIILHHLNKRTSKETRGRRSSYDDFQGAKCISAMCDYSILTNRDAEQPLKGMVHIGKMGSLSEFENYTYEIVNTNKNTPNHRVRLMTGFTEEQLVINSINRIDHTTEIIAALKEIGGDHEWVMQLHLREKLNVGGHDTLFPGVFAMRLETMVREGILLQNKNYYRLSDTAGGIYDEVASNKAALMDGLVLKNVVPDDITEPVAVVPPTLPVPTTQNIDDMLDATIDIFKDAQPLDTIADIQGVYDSSIPAITDRITIALDIETSGLNPDIDRIYSIGLNINGTIKTYTNPDETVVINSCMNALNSLSKLSSLKLILYGHNLISFDLPFIIARCKQLKIDGLFKYRTVGGDPMVRAFRVGGTYPLVFREIEHPFCEIVDTLILTRLNDAEWLFSDQTLKTVAIIIGFRKERRLELTPEEIKNSFLSGDGKLTEYLTFDLEDTKAIFDKFIAPYYAMLSFMRGMTLQEIVISSGAKKFEHLIIKYYRDKIPGYIKPIPDKKIAYRGALTECNPGLYTDIKKIDISSQYPTAALLYRCGSKKDPDGMFLRYLKTFRQLRLEYKAKSKTDPSAAPISAAFKILINSAYGMLGSERAYNDFDGARRITAYSRKILTHMTSELKKRGADIAECDTDGILFCGDVSADDIIATLPPGFEADLEFTARWAYIYKSKNYIIIDKDHTGKNIYKGIFNKRQRVPLQRDFIIDCCEKYITEGPEAAKAYYQDMRTTILNGSMDVDRLKVRKSIGKAEKVCLAFGNVGDKILVYRGINDKNKAVPAISGPYHPGYYAKELDKWYNGILNVQTPQNSSEDDSDPDEEDAK